MNPDMRIAELLRANGMVLIRDHKHRVYKHPDGRSFVTSKTPSDFRSNRNLLRSLERFLGLRPTADKGRAGQ